MEGGVGVIPHGSQICGAKTRGGDPCQNAAGKGTDHVGVGRCRFHGGATPIKHGRYSKVSQVRVADLMEQLTADPDPFDLEQEARLIRALVIDFVNTYDELKAAIMAWNTDEIRLAGDEGRKARPQRIPALEDVASLVEMVSRIIERAQRVKDKSALSLETLKRIMTAMGAAVAKHVDDANALAAIEREWGDIRVSA